MGSSDKYNLKSFGHDFLASIVVFLVAIPLCIGVALASGVSATAGVISGVIGGLFVGVITGCPLQVSGPAAGLITITLDIISEHGLEHFGLIVFGAGLIQLIFGLLKLGQWFRAVSPAVIKGMLTGIGIIIFANQFHMMVGVLPGSNTIDDILKIPSSIVMALSGSPEHQSAAAVGIATILIIVLWEFLPEKYQIVPGALIAVLFTVLVSSFYALPIQYVTVPERIMDDISLMPFGDFAYLFNTSALISIISLAFIASTESMLTATAVDNMHTGARTKYDKEIGAQGLGNMLAGVLGAVPLTGVIVRSSANLHAGGKTRGSTILHGFWLLLFIIFLPHYLAKIPTASLAAILVFTGYKLMNPKTFTKLLKFGKSEAVIFSITIIAIVATSLLKGILIGFAVAFIRLLYDLMHLEVKITEEADRVYVVLVGTANFLNLPKLASIMESIKPKQNVCIFFDQVTLIDHASIDFLTNWERQYIAKGGQASFDIHSLADKFSGQLSKQ